MSCPTSTGYRCRACIGRQQKAFHAGFRPVHYAVAAAVALPASVIAAWLLPSLGCFTVAIGPVAGVGIAELSRWAIRRQRGPHTWLVVCACIVFGWLISLLFSLMPIVSSILADSVDALSLASWLLSRVWGIVYVVAAAAGAYARLRPGRRV